MPLALADQEKEGVIFKTEHDDPPNLIKYKISSELM